MVVKLSRGGERAAWHACVYWGARPMNLASNVTGRPHSRSGGGYATSGSSGLLRRGILNDGESAAYVAHIAVCHRRRRLDDAPELHPPSLLVCGMLTFLFYLRTYR